MYHYLDMHMKCNYNIPVTNKGNGLFTCNSKYAENGKEAKIKELEDIKTYKDWQKYLSFDVRSLSNLIFNVDAMYNDFGFSITNYVGLPGIAMDMMNSYCYNLSKLYVPSDPSMVELCHASIKGGRVVHFKAEWDSPIDEKGNFEDYLICIDMNSLYPSAMFACGFPVGKPELVPKEELESGDWIKHPHFLGEFEVTIPNIRYAIHPYKSEKGALLYPSNQTVIDVYNDVDVREMIKDGYTVKMRKGIYWKKSSKIFSELVNMIFNRRSEYKSMNPDDPDYNKEYICKILLNSMFGKFNETIKSLVRFFTGDEEEMKKTINKMSRVTQMENKQYRINETLKVPRISKPTYIAGYVTAYSRAICNEIFRAVGPEKIFYSDTDSLYMKFSDFNKAKLNCSNGLCGFKNDYGDGVMITKARFLDIKRCYFEFRTRVDSECFDKWGKHRLSCKDPITKEVNKGEPYYVKTFKFKYTGINFKDIVTSSALEPDNKLYSTSKTYEVYNKIMENTSKLVDKFIENNKNNIGKNVKELDNIKFIMKRFKKNGHSVTINLGEFAFVVTREKKRSMDKPLLGFTELKW
jgi:DNA polymerase type B, organellar and viral.